MDSSKLEALNKAISNIEKEYGKGSIMKMDDALIQKVPVISTGSFSLDKALGIGGFPKGRILEIYGPESAGKSTLALSAVAQAQKNGEVCAYVDAEHALSRELAVRLGVNIKELYLSQPESGEQGLEIVEELVRSKAVSVVVVDSVAALVPKAEIEGEMGEAHMALQARLMSQALRKLTSIISSSGTCVIMINQLRVRIGVFFGNPETTTGGNALKFYASLRLDVRRGDLFKKGEDVIGHKIKVKVIKNKLAAPHKVAEISFYYDRGFDNVTDLFNFAVNLNIIERSGSWFSFEGERLGQGSENCLEVLKNNPSLLEKIKSLVEKQLSSSSSLIDIPKEEMEQVLKESEEPELDEIIEPKINTNVVSEVTPTVVKTRGRPKKENKEEVSQ